MCKKLLFLTFLVLMLASIGNAEDIQWTGAGRNKFWSTAANWDLSRPPTPADDVRIDAPAAAAPNGPIIQDGIAAQANGIFTEAAGEPTLTMTGGTLEVTEWIWWGDGADSYAIWTMSGGTVTVANEFELGWGGGAGTLTMTGGTISAGELVIPTGSGTFGLLYLYGGTVNVTQPGGLEVNANGLIDMTEGTLVLEGDETATINDLFEAGLIASYAGEGILNVDYDVSTPGKTTVTAGFVPAPVEPVRPSAAGLVAYYAMENDANDRSGNGNDGAIMGDPNFVEGVSGMALAFDGDGDIIDCGNDPNLAISGAVTMAAWINVGVQGLDHKVGGNQDGANGGYKMSVYSDKIEFEIRTAANSSVLNRSVEGGTVLEAGVWYHVAGVYSLADGYIRTYVDGALDRELLTTEELGVSPGNFFIGCEPFNTTGYNFNGVMDEVYLYNTALSAGEVMYLAGHRAIPVDPGTDNLVARYEFENNVDDSSGNGLHGTVVGDPEFVEGPPGFGMALDFDGDGDYVDCGNPPEFTTTEQISFAYWIKVRVFDADWNTVIAKGDDSWRSSRAGTNNFMEAAVGGTSGNYIYGVTPVDDEQWHHVGAVYDGATFKIYVDGDLDASEESTGQIAVSSYNVYIGENSQATGRFWNGLIDDVVIYNRALTAGEVLYLTGVRAPVVLFAEGFEGLPLGPNVDEALPGETVWTDTPPAGWTIDESGIPGIGDPDTDGVTEWAGWSFANKDWWIETAGDQDRSLFTLGSGTVAIADPDEWDDDDRIADPISDNPYDTWLSTPAIDITGVEAGMLQLTFDSSWRPEFDDNYHQTASITASFDGGDPVEVLLWESDEVSPNYKPYATNETVVVDLGNPEGATSMVLTFGLYDAGNDWWWAIDNIEVSGLIP